MPSKRHGYLTRKEWLADRLNNQRDRAGAFDIERLLRATRFYYNEFDYKSPPTIEARVLADLERQGYSISCGEVTPEQIRARVSPPLTLWYIGHPDVLKNDPAEIVRRWGNL